MLNLTRKCTAATDMIMLHTRLHDAIWTEHLALARVNCNVSHLILGVSEKKPRERERGVVEIGGGKQKVWQPETIVLLIQDCSMHNFTMTHADK